MRKKQQILHIHGGGAYLNYDDYIKDLKLKNYDPDKSNENRWNRNHNLYLDENKFQIFRPEMPCSWNAKYLEWKIWFEKVLPYIKEDVILIGHSLGGNFLAKYLSENVLSVSIKQLHLVAPSYSKFEDDFKITEFPKNFFENNIAEVHIYHSTDDDQVPISESEKYHNDIPNSQFHKFTDRGHFLGDTFSELFENIKKSQ